MWDAVPSAPISPHAGTPPPCRYRRSRKGDKNKPVSGAHDTRHGLAVIALGRRRITKKGSERPRSSNRSLAARLALSAEDAFRCISVYRLGLIEYSRRHVSLRTDSTRWGMNVERPCPVSLMNSFLSMATAWSGGY